MHRWRKVVLPNDAPCRANYFWWKWEKNLEAWKVRSIYLPLISFFSVSNCLAEGLCLVNNISIFGLFCLTSTPPFKHIPSLIFTPELDPGWRGIVVVQGVRLSVWSSVHLSNCPCIMLSVCHAVSLPVRAGGCFLCRLVFCNYKDPVCESVQICSSKGAGLQCEAIYDLWPLCRGLFMGQLRMGSCFFCFL